ncbi:hypothetical protein OESDEN_13026 [Oesophagostomum dentatum]|uniref:Uncharacterized protein n=1 Tax=Oesophagostomum dentatum TaxID=61180 RepID=A0A0B1SQJ1_OESDE|nr:hypothetical protein OESDEN_13026 [Oesophagostomum dentatum]
MEGEKKPQEHEATGSEAAAAGGGDSFPITLVDDNLSNEGSIPIEKIPSMDVTPVETENNDVHSERDPKSKD